MLEEDVIKPNAFSRKRYGTSSLVCWVSGVRTIRKTDYTFRKLCKRKLAIKTPHYCKAFSQTLTNRSSPKAHQNLAKSS